MLLFVSYLLVRPSNFQCPMPTYTHHPTVPMVSNKPPQFQIQFFVEPFHRMFSLNDLRIAFPHAEVERVPLRKPAPL